MRKSVIPSDLDAIDRFIHEAVTAASRYVTSPDRLYEIRLILTEIIANAYCHGNGRDAGKLIHIEYSISERRFALRIRDEGGGFDPAKVPDPLAAENLELDHGRGLYLVRLMSSSVVFHGCGNDVEVVKLFPEAEA